MYLGKRVLGWERGSGPEVEVQLVGVGSQDGASQGGAVDAAADVMGGGKRGAAGGPGRFPQGLALACGGNTRGFGQGVTGPDLTTDRISSTTLWTSSTKQ